MSSNQINDQLRRRASILQNILCRNPDYRDPPYQQPRITRRIAGWPVAHVMRNPINLNRDAVFKAVKVEDVRPNRMLSAKFQTFGALAQDIPKHHFG
jgi:hypothetical protein